MRNQIALSLTIGLMMLVPSGLRADDEKDKKVSGEVTLGAEAISGRRESAKADEYTDLSSGVTSDFKLKYNDKDAGTYATLSGSSLLRRDEQIGATVGKYGDYKVEMSYSELPHHFAFAVPTIYSGEGSASLTLLEGVKNSLGGAANAADQVSRLNQAIAANSHNVDIGLYRKTGKLKIEYSGLQPLRFQLDLSSEDRDGTRPAMGTFGFGNVVELVEPVHYQTSQVRFTGDYTSKYLYLSGGYYLSVFDNEFDSLSYDNPFRGTDSTAAGAFNTPRFVNGVYQNSGAARARVPLAPDSIAHGPSVTAAIRNLPWRTQVTLAGAWGWMEQDNSYFPYTSNSAVTGSDGLRTFNASSVPTGDMDTSVMTSLYNIGVTSHPISWLDASLKYRYYDYDNTSDVLTFPGYVIADGSWVNESVTTMPTSYTKQNARLDLSAKVADKSRVGVFYNYNNTHRENREVANQDENTIGASVDQRVSEMLSVRASYEKSYRHVGDYDFTKPYGGEDMPSQLPLLRKYYEASRDMDAVRVLAMVTPTDELDITGGVMYGNSNYDKSAFGLLDDRNLQLSADVDYTPVKWLTLKTSYSFERHNGSQAGRQWSSGSFGDPYLLDTGSFSNSNWTADSVDQIHTLGAGATVTLIAKKLFFDVNYAYILADGKVSFDSPLGTSGSDANAYVPEPFDQVDSSRGHRLNPSLRYRVTKDGTLSIGYLWEKYTFNDFQDDGFSRVPVNAAGSYNGALLSGAYLLPDYEINMFYASFRYRF